MISSLQNDKLRPKELLETLKTLNLLKENYCKKVRHYILEKHTLLVLGEFDKYFSRVDTPITKSLFRLILALHDIGKPKAYDEGNINRQHFYSLEIIKKVRQQLQLTDKEMSICLSIVSGDPIGMYLQNKLILNDAKFQIIEMAKNSGLQAPNFFKVITIYYQCDVASYTNDAGGLRYLEHLFTYIDKNKMFNHNEGILKFSSILENKYKILKREVLNE
jgi:hypothetical protein